MPRPTRLHFQNLLCEGRHLRVEKCTERSSEGENKLTPVLILVIDDDLDTHEILRVRLSCLGFAVLGTDSGAQGLILIEYHASIGCPIDGVLLNLHMPGHDGMAVLDQMREHHPKIPVIMMSSLPNGGRLERALRGGARDYISESLFEKCLRHLLTPSGRPGDL
jgi:two-component system response regulator FlrC